MNRKILFFIVILEILLTLSTYAQKPIVDSFINDERKKLHIPGFEAVAIQNGKSHGQDITATKTWKGKFR